MPGATSVYGFRYIEPDDPPDLPGGTQNIAEDVEETLAAKQPLYGRGELSTVTTMTGSVVDMPGASVTIVTARPGAVAWVAVVGDFQLVTAGAGTAWVLAGVDGVDQAPQALWNASNVNAGARSTVSTAFPVVLASAGSHTFKLRATGVTNIRLNPTHSHIAVLVLS